jgi:VanZ family protein
MNRRNRALVRAIAPLAVMGAIFYLSAQPGAGVHPWWEQVARKLGHVTGYALLTTAWWWCLRGVVRRPLLVAVAISLAYACTDEFHQTFISGRDGNPRDVGIDAIGMGLAAYVLTRPGVRRIARSSPRASPASSPS